MYEGIGKRGRLCTYLGEKKNPNSLTEGESAGSRISTYYSWCFFEKTGMTQIDIGALNRIWMSGKQRPRAGSLAESPE